jgi:zinc protease
VKPSLFLNQRPIEMIKKLFCFLVFVSLGIVSSHAQTPAPTSYAISDGKTPGGIRLVHMRLKDEKEQALSFYWRDRHVQHTPSKAGLMVLAPALVTLGGSGALDAGAVEEELKDIGGYFGLSRGRSYTFGEISAQKGDLEATAKLFASTLNEPRLPLITLERRKRFLLNNLKANREKPISIANDALTMVVVGDNAIASTVSYSPQTTVSDVTVADIDAWRKAVLARDNLTVVTSGPLTREEAADLTDRTFAGLPEKAVVKDAVSFKPNTLSKTIVIERKVEQSVILIGGSVEWKAGGPVGISRSIAMSVLGGGNRSRLFVAVREKLGAAYGASSGISGLLGDVSVFSMEASVANDKVVPALAAMRLEYQNFRDKGVTADEVDPIKRRMISGFPEAMRKAGSSSGTIRTALLNNLGFQAPDSYTLWVERQKPEDINVLIKSQLPEKLTTIIIAPSAEGLGADCVISSIDDLSKCLVP